MIDTKRWMTKLPSTDYKCYEFVREVWFESFGQELPPRSAWSMRKFDTITHPIDSCFVWMRNKGTTPHIGIYVRGNVLHLAPSGVVWEPVHLATRGFRKVSFHLWSK